MRIHAYYTTHVLDTGKMCCFLSTVHIFGVSEMLRKDKCLLSAQTCSLSQEGKVFHKGFQHRMQLFHLVHSNGCMFSHIPEAT